MNVSCCDYEKCQSGMRHLVFICFDNPNPVVALICALSSSCRGWRRGARCYSVAALTAFGEGDVAFFTGTTAPTSASGRPPTRSAIPTAGTCSRIAGMR